MKDNYKPSTRKIDMYEIDTRMGKDGFYPGDEFVDFNGDKFLILGVSKDGYLVYADEKEKDPVFKIVKDIAGFCTDFKACKRHGQKLIDNGEMRQI